MKVTVSSMKVLGWVACAMLLACAAASAAEQPAGSVVAVRGKGFIERDQKRSEARVRDAVMTRDIVSTAEASRMKLLFSDESVLTLGGSSRVAIREFLAGQKGGSSIFNMIDGKLRAVVGKNAFEVHTPTAVAAARGTIILFETGVRDGKKFTMMICSEGRFLASSSDRRFPEEVLVTEGMAITSIEGEPLPKPVAAPAHERERLLKETDTKGDEISMPGPPGIIGGPWGPVAGPLGGFRPDAGMSASQQPVQPATPVTINVVFPQGR